MAENADILERMRDHLERQVAWLETSLGTVNKMDLSAFAENVASNKPLDEEMIDALLAWQASVEKMTKVFQQESTPLLRTWHAAMDLSDEDRNVMRKLADHAGHLIAELSTKCLLVADRVGGRSTQMHEGLNALARGRGLLNKYRVYTDDDASFIDKKA